MNAPDTTTAGGGAGRGVLGVGVLDLFIRAPAAAAHAHAHAHARGRQQSHVLGLLDEPDGLRRQAPAVDGVLDRQGEEAFVG